jgi:hypothetical protein
MTVSLDLLKAQLNITDDADDVLLLHKLAAASAWIEAQTGTTLADLGPLPADLVEATLQLAAYWFEQREAVVIGVSTAIVPLGVLDLIRPYRAWSFA